MQALNPDVCGWLTIDGTHIDYPLVQGATNMDYINRDVYGEFSLSGAVFLDSRSKADFSDGYSIVYAHHMEIYQSLCRQTTLRRTLPAV